MDRHRRKYNTDTGIENFILRLKENNPDIDYYSGYIDSESKVKLKCNKCGNIFERYANCVRHNRKIRCFECEKIDTQRRKQKEKQAKEYNRYVEKEIKKAINSIQIKFNICKHCGKLYIINKNNNIYCSNRCANRHSEGKHTRERIDKAKQNGKVDNTITLDKLIKRDNNICYICNKECNELDYIYQGNTFIAGNYYPSIDHVVPIAKGGTHEWNNIRLAHRICNSIKSDKPLRE